jgi:hypothetical protein
MEMTPNEFQFYVISQLYMRYIKEDSQIERNQYVSLEFILKNPWQPRRGTLKHQN